jgi:hypothetical protein
MTDILLDDRDGTYVTIEARVVKVQAADFQLDSPQRHRADRPGSRRALVHDQRDGLTVNFNRDYPGGVTINDVVNLNNRFHGITVDDVKEIRGQRRVETAATSGDQPGQSPAAPTLTLRGHILFEANPEHPSSEAVSLQATVSQLREHVAALTKKIDEMQRASYKRSAG